MNPICLQIGSFTIRWYSIFILIGITLGYIIAKLECKRMNIDKDFFFNLFFWTVLIGIIGARTYYVIFNWNIYSDDLVSIFKFWEGGLAIHGGLIAGLIVLIIYCKKYNVNPIKMTDIVAPSIILGQAIGRWGNFFNSEAHGAATTLLELQSKHIPKFIINGMKINDIYYEPTFFYESIWCLLGFIIMLIVRRRKNIKVGTLTSIYCIWYGIGRFIIESMRTDSLMLGGFKVAQLVSIIIFIFGVVYLMIISRKSKYEDLYNSKSKN